MPNSFTLGLIGVMLFLGGCASYSANYEDNHADNNEQVDLYLTTLDDKHFVWCKLDLEKCWKDFEKWKLTPRGRTIIREYEKEDSGQTYNTHHVPNVFRTHFVDDTELTEEVGGLDAGQADGQDSQIFGPQAPSKYGKDAKDYKSP